MILKPTNLYPNAIDLDAANDISISWKNNGDRQYYYQVDIYLNIDGTFIYSSSKVSTFNTYHSIPASTLTNGTEYKYRVTVYNINNESITSDWVVFKCSSTPIASITNVANVIWSNVVNASVNGDVLSKTYNSTNWDAGALSVQAIDSGSGYLEFIAYARNTYVMCGLSYGSSNESYQDVDFAINLKQNGNYHVYENGADKGTFGSYVAGDIFKVAVDYDIVNSIGVVKYYKNNTLFYVSSLTPTYPLQADCSIATLGGAVKSARMSGAKVLNSSYLFTGSYYQAQSVPIKSYNFTLYDFNGSSLATSGEVFSDTIEYQFEGLTNLTNYYIELSVVSQNSLRHNSGKVLFSVEFESPFAALNAQVENIYDNASVRLTWEPKRITGVPSGTVVFIDNEKVNLLNGSVTFLNDVSFSGDFVMKLWLEWSTIPDRTEILRIEGILGYTSVYYNSGTFYANKITSGIPYIFKSNNIGPVNGNVIFLSINHQTNLMSIYAEVVN